MSDHTYDVYYINIPTENIIVSSLNLTDPSQLNNISSSNTDNLNTNSFTNSTLLTLPNDNICGDQVKTFGTFIINFNQLY